MTVLQFSPLLYSPMRCYACPACTGRGGMKRQNMGKIDEEGTKKPSKYIYKISDLRSAQRHIPASNNVPRLFPKEIPIITTISAIHRLCH